MPHRIAGVSASPNTRLMNNVIRLISEIRRMYSVQFMYWHLPGKVPVVLSQPLNESVCAKKMITFMVKLYHNNEGGVYVGCAHHSHITKILNVYIQHY